MHRRQGHSVPRALPIKKRWYNARLIKKVGLRWTRGKELNFLSITPQRDQIQLASPLPQRPLVRQRTRNRSRIPDAALAAPPSAHTAKVAIRQTTHVPKVQTAWYNFDIPFTDYQFDPSLEGIRRPPALSRIRPPRSEWIVDQIKDLVSYGKNG